MINFKNLILKSPNFSIKKKFDISAHHGRRLIIPDIHGCYDTLIALIKQIGLLKTDHLFFMGDYINRGENSNKVLDFIINLMEEGYHIYPLRGNHEDMLLNKHILGIKPMEPDVPHLYKYEGLLDHTHQILPKYLPFLSNLPFCFELDKYILVHAGINFSVKRPLEDYESMLWRKEFFPVHSRASKIIITGHKPRALNEIEDDILYKRRVLRLDNGAVYTKRAGMGNLLCLDITNNQLYIQANIEERKYE